MTLNLGALNDF